MMCDNKNRMEKVMRIGRSIRLFSFFGAGIIFMLLLIGCANETSDWEDAVSKNSMDGYTSFLEKYPDSRYLAEAEKKLIAARWENAREIDTAASYKQFLETNIRSQFADDAIQKLGEMQPARAEEMDAFKAAESLNIHAAYDQFIEKFPNSALFYSARLKMARFGTFVGEEEILLSTEALKETYHWNGEKILWKWDNKAAGLEMPGGSIMFFSDKTVDPSYAIPFSFGFSGKVFGNICMGNIQISGPCHFEKNGLVLHKGSKIYFPL